MKSNIKNYLTQSTTTTMDANSMAQFLALLDMPDDKFDALFPQMISNFKNVMESPAFRKEILNNLETVPTVDIQAEVEGLEKVLNEIETDTELSASKKELLTYIIGETGKVVISAIKVPREQIKVKIQKVHEDAMLPTYAHDTDAGADIYAIEDVVLKPHTTQIIDTGFKIAIPTGYMINIVPRSGLSLKSGLRVANTPGVIDSDYRGNVGVIIENTANLTYTIKKGDKIAQMLINPTPMIVWDEVETLDETDRRDGGFGSTDQ